MKSTPALLLFIVMMSAFGSAPAQTQTRSTTVYRCGPEGRDLRDSPCPAAAKASTAQVEFDQPSSAQSRAARDLAIADAKRARAMEQARITQETEARHRAARAGGIDGLATPPPAKPASAAQPKAEKTAKAPKLHKPKPPKTTPASG